MKSYVDEKLKLTEELGAPVGVEGFIPGQAIHVSPFTMETILSFTTPIGVASGIVYGYLFLLGRWGFNVSKVNEWIEVSPVHAQYYQLTTQQKQQLENQIRQGLTSVQTAVSDFELLFHDLRKYKEFLNTFNKIEKGKKEKEEKLIVEGEQTLKGIFIDQVDAHTGEGIALRTIAPRWPTIIVDFMRLKDEDTDPKEIAKKYKFSVAEGVVLSTKNKLYKEWRDMFKETVIGRYERIKSLVEARKKSIEEYRNLLKPYIMRYRSIRELGETESGRALLQQQRWFRSAAQAVSTDNSEIWAWKPFHPPDLAKAAIESLEKEKKPVLSLPFPEEFKKKIKEDWKRIKAENLEEVTVSPNNIEPLDKWTMRFIPELEKHYNNVVKFSPVDILKVREEFIKMYDSKNWPRDPYFMVLVTNITRTVLRLPTGSEIENITFEPFKVFLDTQNIILVRMLELKLLDLDMERYISSLIGEKVDGKKIEELVKEEYPLLYGGEEIGGKEMGKIKKAKETVEKVKKISSEVGVKFIKSGPYETNFYERIVSPYFKEMADIFFRPSVRYLKTAVGAPT